MKEFIKKFLGFSIGPIVGAIISFITVPVTSHLVSAEQFGLTNMFTITSTVVSLIALIGIDQAFISEYNETEDRKKLLFNSLLIPFVSTLIIGVVLIVFREKFGLWLFNDEMLTNPIILLAIASPLLIVENFMLLIIRMQEKAFQYSFWNIVSKSLNLILTVLLLIFYKNNFESIIYATVFSRMIVSISLVIICKRQIGVSLKYFDKNQINRLIRFGLPLLPATLIGWGLTSMDSIFLRSIRDYNELGYYSVALKTANILGIIQAGFTSFWTPLAFRWKAEKEKNAKFELVSQCVALAMSIVLIIILLFKNIIPYLLGEGYEQVVFIMPFLLFYPIFYTMSETTTLGIFFTKKTFYNIIISIVAVLSNFVLNMILIQRFGAVGASIATGMSYVVFFWARTLISRKLWFKFDIKKFIITTIVLILISLINIIFKSLVITTFANLISLVLIIFNYKNIVKFGLEYLNKRKNTKVVKGESV